MKLILKNGMSVLYKNGMSLTGLNIDSIVAESKEDRADLRMLLMGALKVDEDGCHQLGRGFGSNALATNPDVSNGSRALGNEASKVKLSELLTNCALDTKIEVINALSAVVNIDGHFDAKCAAREKLSLLIQKL
ncbi:hypothetical protein E0H89_11360 [Acinetobacter sp. ANC 3781]|jgi:hypothetical protein|uniref:hypothetical protein n=1 Tax=Acinetobacter sp. ANC 3781 TaxID=2529835 RepID=UPI001039673B|nr:hypothetical protein [Acinetobacter sp. ANC 3781]TCB75535.1 hypothetical protein E0H89_11360 [Acinetobacter sp. ANC 3781]